MVREKHLSHFNVHALDDPGVAARWHNAVQRMAESTPHGIPVTISSDPRHAFIENSGVSFSAKSFSQWPEPLGLAALGDADLVRRFADIARQEYVAVGIRAALHPTLDLATEARWGRQAGTFGQDADLVTELGVAYLEGFQGSSLGSDAVACTSKHFPGGGPQKDGEDAHFPYGREQVYPGGQFALHLKPFPAMIAAGTAGIMPYYGMPIGLEIDGEADPRGRLRLQQADRHRPAPGPISATTASSSPTGSSSTTTTSATRSSRRARGASSTSTRTGRMELILEAGADQFGGEECVEILLDLVAQGRVTEERIDVSARRLLAVKFRLGLFDDPYVDEDAASDIVGRTEFRDAGYAAQAESVTLLHHVGPVLPLTQGLKVYVEGVRPEAVARHATVVEDPADADVAIIRIGAPFDPRSDLFLESWFHQGSLDFPPGLVARLRRIADACPLVLDVALDRPAVLTPMLPFVSALTATYGSSDEARARRADRAGSRRAGGCPSTCPARWSRCAPHPRTCPASTTRSSPSATASPSDAPTPSSAHFVPAPSGGRWALDGRAGGIPGVGAGESGHSTGGGVSRCSPRRCARIGPRRRPGPRRTRAWRAAGATGPSTGRARPRGDRAATAPPRG